MLLGGLMLLTGSASPDGYDEADKEKEGKRFH